MEIGKAFGAPLRDPKWIGKIALGVVLMWIPLVNLAVPGWGISYVRNVHSGREDQLPEWSDFGTHWMKGLTFALAQLVYYAPVIVIVMAFGLPGMLTGSVQRNGLDGVGMMLGSVFTGLFVALLFAAVVSVLVQAARVHFAVHGEFASAFDIKGVWSAVGRRSGDYFVAWFVGILALTGVGFIGGLVGGVLGAIPCIGWMLLLVLTPMVQGLGLTVGMGVNALYGQYANNTYSAAAHAPSRDGVSTSLPIGVPAVPAPSYGNVVAPPVVRPQSGVQPGTNPNLTGQAAVAAALAALGKQEGNAPQRDMGGSGEQAAKLPGIASAPAPPESVSATPMSPGLTESPEPGHTAGPPNAEPGEEAAESSVIAEPIPDAAPEPEFEPPALVGLQVPREMQPALVSQDESEPGGVAEPVEEAEPDPESSEPDSEIEMATETLAEAAPEGASSVEPGGGPVAANESDEAAPMSEPIDEASPAAIVEDPVPASDAPVASVPHASGVPAIVALERLDQYGESGDRWVLPRADVRVGRGEECYIVLADSKVSREHALISRHEDGSVTIRDLGSSNGTYVNRKRIEGEATALGFDDEIRIGDSVLRLARED